MIHVPARSSSFTNVRSLSSSASSFKNPFTSYPWNRSNSGSLSMFSPRHKITDPFLHSLVQSSCFTGAIKSPAICRNFSKLGNVVSRNRCKSFRITAHRDPGYTRHNTIIAANDPNVFVPRIPPPNPISRDFPSLTVSNNFTCTGVATKLTNQPQQSPERNFRRDGGVPSRRPGRELSGTVGWPGGGDGVSGGAACG